MKQKHWKVSVFDQTSETIRDDTFYTTDTEVYLTFELIDENFTPDSATVTVYNVYGKATINKDVDIVNGIVNYEMPEDAIGHTGGWRTQVVYTKDNEDYTTMVIEFDVDGHLLDNKKPAIVDIKNWNSFIKHSGRLIDDWEQLEKIRQSNERQRERAESKRQTKFETNEKSRQTNERTRVSAESERVSNEEERISKDSERDSKIEAVEGVVEDVSDRIDNKVDVSELELYAKKEQEDWIIPTLQNGWVQHSHYAEVGYYKDDFGVVHLRGSLSDGVANKNVFTLPVGYRPNKYEFYVVPINTGGNVFGSLYIAFTGDVYSYSTGPNLSLSNVSFRAER